MKEATCPGDRAIGDSVHCISKAMRCEAMSDRTADSALIITFCPPILQKYSPISINVSPHIRPLACMIISPSRNRGSFLIAEQVRIVLVAAT